MARPQRGLIFWRKLCCAGCGWTEMWPLPVAFGLPRSWTCPRCHGDELERDHVSGDTAHDAADDGS